MSRPIHTKKLFGGNETAEEVHQRLGFPAGAKCQKCGKRPYIGALTYARYEDASNAYPEIAAMDVNAIGHILLQLRGADGRPMNCVRLGRAYACVECSKEFERSLAKLPSWVLVEIQRGPTSSKFLSGSRGGSLV